MRALYSFLVFLAWQCLKVLSIFNEKLKEFVNGRKSNSNNTQLINPIWVHCASVGEFEQARPLIELIKSKYNDQSILLTFFSPSGFNHLHDYKLADRVCYAPFDTPSQVRAFLADYNPKALLLIKYEFWKNMLYFCSKSGIPVFSVSSIFREKQPFFKWYGHTLRADLSRINHFFVQNERSQSLLNSIGISNISVSGDTRFDRVIAIAEKSMEVESIKKYCNAAPTLIAGSTWPKDEEVLLNAFDQFSAEWKLIIAPHEVNSARIEELLQRFKTLSPVCLSGATETELAQCRVLIIDSIGILNRIYKHATLCYIGGGFGAGLHNILEAAVWGKPLVHGSNYQKFKEAVDLSHLGGSSPAGSMGEAVSLLVNLASDPGKRSKKGAISKEYVYQNEGASEKVISILESERIF